MHAVNVKRLALARTRDDRRGLTLLELVIVLAILAALAAVVIPMFPNLLRRAHKSIDATQTNEISKALQLYQGMFVSYPDHFDLLTDGTDFPSYIPNDGGDVFGNFVVTDVLTIDERKALGRVGIKYVEPLATDAGSAAVTPSGFHVTMNPYAAASPSADDIRDTVGDTLNFALLDTTVALKNDTLKNAIEQDPTARFVVFGVGPRCTMVGQTIQDAPTSVPQNKDFTPDTMYSRIGVIFKVSGEEVSRTERARFICAVAMEDDELESTEKDIIGYYEVARDPAGG